ncbi:hypothetical protein JAAARDRAFT_71211 [Jaapia argillacea MUCL 33604]|uniref:Hyaluronan-mediated motility receptor C-terminal domain-containing protein n=1 Tax=Jaapia argillacea MUCL 33604 TaxID=933084 RepID=A0A067PM03_9AGAM|nr:hypothetical protein JAAARDRAFT_71211 [Jaapia argillacea MUCL 33604]
MFPRGPRFAPPKIPDVPGPGTYNPTQEQLEAYKRGAFLEKADRFNNDPISDLPGPGTYNTETKPPTTITIPNAKVTTNTKSTTQPDKYVVLQRKLEDLERIHTEGKKAHTAELSSLKQTLSSTQRSLTDSTSLTTSLQTKLKSLTNQLSDLKKSHVALQAEYDKLKLENKDLKVRLKREVGERERKEGVEVREEVRAVREQAKEEVRVAKELAKEEVKIAKEVAKEEVRAAKEETKSTKEELKRSQRKAFDLETSLTTERAAHQQALTRLVEESSKVSILEKEVTEARDVHSQLEATRSLVVNITNEYARLTTSPPSHCHQCQLLTFSNLHLSTKLANSQSQVTELAHLIRSTKDQNALLKVAVKEGEKEVEYLRCTRERGVESSAAGATNAIEELVGELRRVDEELDEEGRKMEEVLGGVESALLEVYRELGLANLEFATSVLGEQVEVHAANFVLQTSCETLSVRLSEMNKEVEVERQRAGEVEREVGILRREVEEVKVRERRLVEEGEKLRMEVKKQKDEVRRKEEVVGRLGKVIGEKKAVEEGLREEVESLSQALSEAEPYISAYSSLLDQVNELVARNELAEEEAEKLSAFNAEILGHRNESQRILYVDRVRRELGDVKQKLLMSNLEVEALLVENGEMRRELGMYKSVQGGGAVGGGRRRVGRVPLVQVVGDENWEGREGWGGKVPQAQGKGEVGEVGYRDGDMTLDEIM